MTWTVSIRRERRDHTPKYCGCEITYCLTPIKLLPDHLPLSFICVKAATERKLRTERVRGDGSSKVISIKSDLSLLVSLCMEAHTNSLRVLDGATSPCRTGLDRTLAAAQTHSPQAAPPLAAGGARRGQAEALTALVSQPGLSSPLEGIHPES